MNTKTKKKRVRQLWSFHIRNKFTLVEFPVILVFGFDYCHAQRNLFRRFSPSLYEVIDQMVITNPDFMALVAVVFPDLRNYGL